jgi:hypothetical protein
MVTKMSTAVVVALVAFLAAPTASFAASKKSESDQQSQSTQRGPYISRAVRYITRDQKQENIIAIRQRIAEIGIRLDIIGPPRDATISWELNRAYVSPVFFLVA